VRGNRGELCAVLLSDHAERFHPDLAVRIDGAPYVLERVWYHKGQPIFKFRGVDSIGAAEALAGKDVCVAASERFELPEGEYYYSDLVGCGMYETGASEPLGTVTGWQSTGGPVLLEINGGEILVPFARTMIKNINVQSRRIEVDLPEGLKDLNKES
jgi:16S rRNA processing protein RimM